VLAISSLCIYLLCIFVGKQETVFRHEGAKNSSSSNTDPALKSRSKSLSTGIQQQAATVSDAGAVTSSNCDASGDSSYDQSSGLSPWLVTAVNCAGRNSAAGRKPTQSTRSTTSFPLTTEL